MFCDIDRYVDQLTELYSVATEFKRKTCYPQTFSVYRRPWPLINLTLGPSWERVVYMHDHTIFTHKINKLILITHFTNLILSTKSSAKDKRGKVCLSCFFSICIMSHLPSDAYLSTLLIQSFLTTVNTAFVFRLFKRSGTRSKVN